MSLKEEWNKETTTKQKFWAGVIMTAGFTVPMIALALNHLLPDSFAGWVLMCWGCFFGWTVITYTWRNDFKQEWK